MTQALAFSHKRVQRLRRLVQRRSVRRAEGAFVVEGPKLLGAALDAGAAVEAVFVEAAHRSDPALAPVLAGALDRGARVFELAPGVLPRVAGTVTPQPVLAVVATPTTGLDDLGRVDFVVVCVDVRDPGNAGAVIRVADAAGADAVVCCDGTVDAFNPKTVRASAGSVLHIPVVQASATDALASLASRGVRRVGAVARGGVAYTALDVASPLALVLGNEARGLSPTVDDALDERVSVPMTGGAESLNVSTAAAVLCFEVTRRRSNLHAMDGAP